MRRGRFLVAALVLLVSFTAHATLVQRMEVEDLARAAQVVAVARVESVQAAWEQPQRDVIRTHAMLVLESTIAGAAPQRIHVTVLGGTADGIDAVYPAGAIFREGERVVVFLEARRGRAGEWLVTGAFQGMFSLEREAETGMDVAVRASSRAGVALVGGEDELEDHGIRLYADELFARIRAARGAR